MPSLWPLEVANVLVCELSMGQFVEDVRLAVEGRCEVHLKRRAGGALLTPEEVVAAVRQVAG